MKLSIIILSLFVTAVNIDISEVRTLYKQTDGSKENTLLLYNKLQVVTEQDNIVLLAYKGATIAMKGRFEKGVKDKTTVFKKGVALIEKVVAKEPNNIEIRFVRLSIQQNSPKFLKYKSNIEVDKSFILDNFQKIKYAQLKNYIKDYILNSNHFTEEEKSVTSQP